MIAVPAPAGVAFAVACALWMVLAPELPGSASRRTLVGALTWLATRAVLVKLSGAPWLACAATLCADLVVWAALEWADRGGNASWSWAAAPAAAWVMLHAGQSAAAGAAAVAVAMALLPRGRGGGAIAALALAGVAGGAWVAAAALPFALAEARRPARAVPLALAVAAALVFTPQLRAWAAFPDPVGGPSMASGPSLWRLPWMLGAHVPDGLAWVPAVVVGLVGAMLLARRGAAAPAFGVWAFAAFAAFAPGYGAAHLAPWLPFVCAWAAGDPDRRGWWTIAALALPLALVAEAAAPVTPLWRGLALLVVLAAGLLPLWPLATLAARPRPAR